MQQTSNITKTQGYQITGSGRGRKRK